MATSDQSDSSSKVRLRRFRFGLRTLLGVVTASGFALGWYVIHRDIQRARVNYEYAERNLEVGRIAQEDVCEASLAVREAECRMPLYSHRAAGAEHLVRMLKLRMRTEPYVRVAMFADPDAGDRILAMIDRYCEEAEKWFAEQ